ncbi:MAG: methylmalonyl Co-A mutase-associated GTPase MeaB [Acidobacteriota bacterium]|nr:methylmalonyl Co-A mutase-associated GTPase MeaB [Acidobacteriota bacterium]
MISLRNIRALARAATAIENQTPESVALLEEISAHPGAGRVIGITGPPGAGKSTLVDALAQALRNQNKTVGILAVDPTSRASGGAILGDRIRMQRHHADPGIFIRSMATRGSAGGIAKATANVAKLFRHAGFDFIVIETVGVGQDEIEVAALADVTLVVLVPGMGDGVQAIKAGILEIADIFVINKADYPGAGRAERELHAGGWSAPVLKTVATEGAGIPELIDAMVTCPIRARKPDSEPQLDHLGIAVHSIDAALLFYSGALKLPVALRETIPGERVNIAMLPAGSPRIELLEPAEPDSVIGRFLGKRGEGLHHIALRVPDLAATVQALKDSGARLLGEPRRGAGGHLYVFVHPDSTGGVLLELIQS